MGGHAVRDGPGEGNRRRSWEPRRRRGDRNCGRYLAGCSPPCLRLAQLYFFWNFSTRPVVSTNFILPVKNGCDALEMSSVISGYSLPSSQTVVWFVLAQERDRNEKWADVS